MKCPCNEEIIELLHRKFGSSEIENEVNKILGKCPYEEQIENSEKQILTIAINEDSADPLHSQVYSNIKELIVRGELKSDDILPTISSLSKRLGICEGTVKIAYRNLEKDGYIYTGLYKRKYVN